MKQSTKHFLLIVAFTIVGALAMLAVAKATPAPKVFVCKYVGSPGINETLQTGQNPISVSLNAIPDGTGVGDSFADQHGRSLVIAFDEGQDEPECPAPTPPEEEPEPEKEEPIDRTPVNEGGVVQGATTEFVGGGK